MKGFILESVRSGAKERPVTCGASVSCLGRFTVLTGMVVLAKTELVNPTPEPAIRTQMEQSHQVQRRRSPR